MDNLNEDIEEVLNNKILNCIGTMTALGGSRMSHYVLDKMQKASQNFIDIVELNIKCS